MSEKHILKIEKTATYYTLGSIETAETIWFVLHGYGYLAKFFINKFSPILDDKTCVIAPEGLSKFYLNGVGVDGRVGASWMTKENRENEIIDYVNYLNQLYNLLITNKNLKINIVGFSQGGATACRWVSDGKIKVDNFILWASVFPDDINFKTIENVTTFFLYGDDDEYVTEERIKKQQTIFIDSGVKVTTIPFKGTHDIPKDVLIEETKKNNW
ncbi:MAG: dienelactone hydrolase family protein [Flavobacteriales bacterium]|nr:dienelactone hydrolase family protein [Flavobacteriales bacterium]